MHDHDRTQLESGFDALETDQFEFTNGAEVYGDSEASSPFSESQEMDLASELLALTNDAELDQFLGNLFKKVGGAVGKFMKGPVGRSLGGMLKGVAKRALPVLGGALGSFIPGIGTAIGSTVGTAASNLFEVELEGLSPEDQEYEVARRLVRLASGAAKKAGLIPPGFDPRAAAKAALAAAAKQYAPGLLSLLGETGPTPMAPAAPSPLTTRPGHSGRWIRRGQKIILLGV